MTVSPTIPKTRGPLHVFELGVISAWTVSLIADGSWAHEADT